MGIPCARTEPFLSAMRAQKKCATWIFLRANPLRGSDTPWSMLTLLMREEDKHSWHSYSNSVFSVPEWNASTAPSRLISSNSCRHVSPFKFEKIPTVLSCTAEKGPKPDWERRCALNACKGGESAREEEIDGKRERRRRKAQNCAGWNVWWVHFLFSQVTMTGRFNFFNRMEINQTAFLVGVSSSSSCSGAAFVHTCRRYFTILCLSRCENDPEVEVRRSKNCCLLSL